MDIKIASSDQIGKLCAFLAIRAKGTRFEIPAVLLKEVEQELRVFCRAHRITVKLKDASTQRVVVFAGVGILAGTLCGTMCAGFYGAVTGALLGGVAGVALAHANIQVLPAADNDNLILVLA